MGIRLTPTSTFANANTLATEPVRKRGHAESESGLPAPMAKRRNLHPGPPRTSLMSIEPCTFPTEAAPALTFDCKPLKPGEFTVPKEFHRGLRNLCRGIPWFPADMRHIHVVASTELAKQDVLARAEYGDVPIGGTHVNRPITVTLGLRPDAVKTPALEAQLLYSLTHEVGDHALDNCRSFSRGIAPLPGVIHHMKLCLPADASNGFHKLVKSTLRYVPAHLRTHYLEQYAVDVLAHALSDADGHPSDPETFRFKRGTQESKSEGVRWAHELLLMAAQPHHDFWKHDSPDANPMEVTGVDTKEAARYERFLDAAFVTQSAALNAPSVHSNSVGIAPNMTLLDPSQAFPPIDASVQSPAGMTGSPADPSSPRFGSCSSSDGSTTYGPPTPIGTGLPGQSMPEPNHFDHAFATHAPEFEPVWAKDPPLPAFPSITPPRARWK